MSVKLGPGLVALALAGSSAFAQQTKPKPPNPWQPEEPQGHWSQTWHDGFRAGAAAANADAHAERPLDISQHREYRRPDLAPMAREDFRDGYQEAYDLVRDHMAHEKKNN